MFWTASHGQDPRAPLGLGARPSLQIGKAGPVEAARLSHNWHGTFHHARTPSLLFDEGLGATRPRVKWRELERPDGRGLIGAVQSPGRREERQVNRILIRLLRRQRSIHQHLLRGEPMEWDHAGDVESIHREGAGLVHAEDVHRRRVFRCAEARHQHPLLRQL